MAQTDARKMQGGERYPHFPTPLLQDLELQMPLVNLDNPQGQLAEKYLRESVFVQHRKDGAPADDFRLKTELARVELQTEKHLLQIIQTFCKADRLEAALDASLLLTQPASLVAASKIAGFFTLPALQERIELVQQMRNEAGDPDAAAAKRQSKWGHLDDERYITTGSSAFGKPDRAAATLFGPGSGEAFSSRKAFGTPSASVASTSKKRRSMPSAPPPDVAGSDDPEPVDFEADLEYGGDAAPTSSPKRMRLDSEDLDEEAQAAPAPAPPKKGQSFPEFPRRAHQNLTAYEHSQRPTRLRSARHRANLRLREPRTLSVTERQGKQRISAGPIASSTAWKVKRPPKVCRCP